jgi:hypothetical protein
MLGTSHGRKPACLVALAALTLLVAGCGKGISKGNYEKIKPGMSLQDVEKLLGKGEEVAAIDVAKLPGMDAFKAPDPNAPTMPGVPPIDFSKSKFVKWGDDQKFIVVMCQGDQVLMKQSKGL